MPSNLIFIDQIGIGDDCAEELILHRHLPLAERAEELILHRRPPLAERADVVLHRRPLLTDERADAVLHRRLLTDAPDGVLLRH